MTNNKKYSIEVTINVKEITPEIRDTYDKLKKPAESRIVSSGEFEFDSFLTARERVVGFLDIANDNEVTG